MRKFILACAGLCFILFFISSCSGVEKLETVQLDIGRDRYTVEIARSPEERQQGLMNREELGEREGMIFVFEKDQRLSFWMKNTKVPLSIAYISKDGTVKEIYDMEPLSTRAVKSSYSVRYALELPQGAFSLSGVEPGDQIDLGPLLKVLSNK